MLVGALNSPFDLKKSRAKDARDALVSEVKALVSERDALHLECGALRSENGRLRTRASRDAAAPKRTRGTGLTKRPAPDAVVASDTEKRTGKVLYILRKKKALRPTG
jgi:hypothetical protein